MADDNPSPLEHQHLAFLAYQLEDDKRFMAYALRLYRDREQLTAQDISDELHTTPEMLVRLALCKRPNKRSPQFTEQLQQLSVYTGIDIERLKSLFQRLRH